MVSKFTGEEWYEKLFVELADHSMEVFDKDEQQLADSGQRDVVILRRFLKAAKIASGLNPYLSDDYRKYLGGVEELKYESNE